MTSSSSDRIRTSRHVFSEMEPADAGRLFDRLTPVVAASMTPEVNPAESWAVQEWEHRRAEILAQSSVYVVSAGDDVHGFVTYRLIDLVDRVAVVLGVGCVRPEHQSHGIAFAINYRVVIRAIGRSRGRGFFIVARVLNPAAMFGWRKQIHDPTRVWPYIGSGARPGRDVERAALAFVDEFEPDSTFDRITGVLKGRHPMGVRVPQASGSVEVDDFYRDHVDLDGGDTVLMVIDADRTVLVAHAGRIVSSFGRVAGNWWRRSRS